MVQNNSVEQSAYDQRWSGDEYSALNAGYTPNFLRFMNRWVGSLDPQKRRALEVGCGDGFFSAELARAGCTVTGIDLSPVGVAKAQLRCPSGSFRVHDLAQPMPFDSGSFDVAWCSEVLEHLFSPLDALKEIHRVLAPGGLLLATVPYHGLLKNIGIALLAFERHYDPEYVHIRFFTRRSLGALAAKAGFSIRFLGSCGSNFGLRDLLVPTNILMVAEKPR